LLLLLPSIEPNQNLNSHAFIRILCNQTTDLKVCHINAQSLTNKIDEFRYLFENSKVDIICVSETWFTSNISSSYIRCADYNLFRSDRVNHAGSVAIFVRKQFKCKVICQQALESAIKYLFVEVRGKNYKYILLGCAYRPHRTTCYSDLLADLTALTGTYKNVDLTGDFNMITRTSASKCHISYPFFRILTNLI